MGSYLDPAMSRNVLGDIPGLEGCPAIEPVVPLADFGQKSGMIMCATDCNEWFTRWPPARGRDHTFSNGSNILRYSSMAYRSVMPAR